MRPIGPHIVTITEETDFQVWSEHCTIGITQPNEDLNPALHHHTGPMAPPTFKINNQEDEEDFQNFKFAPIGFS
jgi:hypothetical protein